MNESDFHPDDLDVLLSALCDSRLTERQLAQLNGLLRSTRICAAVSALHGRSWALHHVIPASRSARDEAVSDLRSPCETPGRSDGRPRPGLVVFALRVDRPGGVLFVVCGGIGALVWWWPRCDSPPRLSKPAPIVARISGGAGARFDGNGPPAGLNDPLRAGAYRLVEGILQVTFARGEGDDHGPGRICAPVRRASFPETGQAHRHGPGTSQGVHRRDAERDPRGPGDGVRGGRRSRRQRRGSRLPGRSHRTAPVADRFAAPAAERGARHPGRRGLGHSFRNRARFEPVSAPSG